MKRSDSSLRRKRKNISAVVAFSATVVSGTCSGNDSCNDVHSQGRRGDSWDAYCCGLRKLQKTRRRRINWLNFWTGAESHQTTAKELLAEVTRHLHRLRVCTLDSFFQQVARSLTLELGLPPGWSIVDEHTDRELREQAIDAVLSQQVPEDAQQLMHMLAKGRSKRSVRDLIDETVTNFHELFLLTDDEAWNKLPKYTD